MGASAFLRRTTHHFQHNTFPEQQKSNSFNNITAMSDQYPKNNLGNEPEYPPPYTHEMLSEYLVTQPPSTTDPAADSTTASRDQAPHRPRSAEELLQTMLANPSSSAIDIGILQTVLTHNREIARLAAMREINMRQAPILGVSGQSSIQLSSNLMEEELARFLDLDHSSTIINSNYSEEFNITSASTQFLAILTTGDSLHTANQQLQVIPVDNQSVPGPASLADSSNLTLPHQTPVVRSQANSAPNYTLPCPPVSDMAHPSANLTHSHLAPMFNELGPSYPTIYNPLACVLPQNLTSDLAINPPNSLDAGALQSENTLRQNPSFQDTAWMTQVLTPPPTHVSQLGPSLHTQYHQNEMSQLSSCHPQQFLSLYKFVVEKHDSLLALQPSVPQSSTVLHKTTTAVAGKRARRDSTLGEEPASGVSSMTDYVMPVSEPQSQGPSSNKKRKTTGASRAMVKKPTKEKKAKEATPTVTKENALSKRQLPKHRNQFIQLRSLLYKILTSWVDKQDPSTIPVQDQANHSRIVGKVWRTPCKDASSSPHGKGECESCDNCRMRGLFLKAATERKQDMNTLVTQFRNAPDRLKRTFETDRRQIEEAFDWTKFEQLYLKCSLFTSFADVCTKGQLPTVKEIRTMWVDHEVAYEQEKMQKFKKAWMSKGDEEEEEEEDASE